MPKRRRRHVHTPNRKHGRTDAEATAAAQGWSSLPSDLLNHIGDSLLASNDMDAYMDMRAVCQHWRRSATADPRADPRFRPTQWVMLDDVVKHYYSRDYGRDDSRLFVHTATGRFLRKRLPLLRDYDLVTSTAGGLLVLADRARAASPRTSVRVLNPFTGTLVRFAAPMPMPTRGPWRFVADVVGSTSSPTLFLVSIVSDGGPNKVYWADPQSASFSEEISSSRCPASSLPLLSAAECATDVSNRALFIAARMVLDVFGADVRYRCYAVEVPGGGMLKVVKSRHRLYVFKVSSAGNQTELVKSIGSLALFLGVRCIAIDASMFRGIQANCAYFPMAMAGKLKMELAIYKFDIGAEAEYQEPEFVEEAIPYDRPYPYWTPGPSYWSFNSTPFTLTQVLCNYTMDIPRDPPMWKLDSGRYGRQLSFDDMAPYIHREDDNFGW